MQRGEEQPRDDDNQPAQTGDQLMSDEVEFGAHGGDVGLDLGAQQRAVGLGGDILANELVDLAGDHLGGIAGNAGVLDRVRQA